MTAQDYGIIIGTASAALVAIIGAVASAIVAIRANGKSDVNAAKIDGLQTQADNHETRITGQDAQLTKVGLATTAPAASVSTSGPVVVDQTQGGTSV